VTRAVAAVAFMLLVVQGCASGDHKDWTGFSGCRPQDTGWAYCEAKDRAKRGW